VTGTAQDSVVMTCRRPWAKGSRPQAGSFPQNENEPLPLNRQPSDP